MDNNSTITSRICDFAELVTQLAQKIRDGLPDCDAAAIAIYYMGELDAGMAGWSRSQRRSHRYAKTRRKLVKIIARAGVAPATSTENVRINVGKALNLHDPEEAAAFFHAVASTNAKVSMVAIEDYREHV